MRTSNSYDDDDKDYDNSAPKIPITATGNIYSDNNSKIVIMDGVPTNAFHSKSDCRPQG